MTAISLNPDSLLFLLYCTVRGIRHTSVDLSDEIEGSTREVKREVTETIADADEATAAKKLANRVRATGAKFCTTVRNFTVSDGRRVKLFLEELAPLREEIALHNASAKHHPVEVEFTPVPLAASLSPETAQSIYNEIAGRLDAVKEHVERGDIKSLDAWLRRNKALGAFIGAAAQGALEDAFGELTSARESIKARIKGDSKLGVAPVLPEVAGAAVLAQGLYAVDTARGLIIGAASPAAPNAPTAPRAQLALVSP